MTGPLKCFASWLTPDRYEERISGVRPEELRALGIGAVILDLDNTFLPWKSDTVPEENLAWAEDMKQKGIELFVLSNTTKPARMKAICSRIGAKWLHPAAKPNRKSFLRAAELLGLEPGRIAVAGDQLFTDMLGGRLAGMYLILVKP
ncbi:MAG: YqeG family HAD IIIA-type phosphatase, partial [Abditibacteriota bacterium]|nr:YqeG family HAD IIIA-type phosphatase [Abditibacteriota bacterium]